MLGGIYILAVLSWPELGSFGAVCIQARDPLQVVVWLSAYWPYRTIRLRKIGFLDHKRQISVPVPELTVYTLTPTLDFIRYIDMMLGHSRKVLIPWGAEDAH